MTQLSEILKEDHRWIRRAAACLERLVDIAEADDDLRIVSAIELLEFFEVFADGAHQEKEERHLFPAMLAAGLRVQGVRCLLGEHREERAALEEMRESLGAASHGRSVERERFVRVAARYAALQLRHVDAEETNVVPLAGELLDDLSQAEVVEGFHDCDAELLRRPREQYFELVATVAARLGSSVPPES